MFTAERLKTFAQKLRWPERLFLASAVPALFLLFLAPASSWTGLFEFLTFIFGAIVVVRLLRIAARHAIWRVRNRLIVTYLFIGGVPILLIAALVGLTLYALANQFAVYLVNSEVDRRVAALQSAAAGIAKTEPASRVETMRRMTEIGYRDRFPGVVMMLRTPAGVARYPANVSLDPPPPATGEVSGVVIKDGDFYIWSHMPFAGGDVTVAAPMSAEVMSGLVPNLGSAQLLATRPAANSAKRSNATGEPSLSPKLKVGNQSLEVEKAKSAKLPPPVNRFDSEVAFASVVPARFYTEPQREAYALLYVHSRASAVYQVLVSRKSDFLSEVYPIFLAAVSIAFLIVEIVSLIVGITMTRTITGTVHHLYEGTQRVMQGDFSHRIEVKGRDQLATLANSFNLMTGRIENLLAVAKEKERLQSEIEIAREVQNQLYPKRVPDVQSLRLTAVCKPARMVSGDYFDYECVREAKVALAIGDVAGKGISAALLMATLQSSLRTELRASAAQMAMAAGNGKTVVGLSTSELVGHLNQQLHANTSPEKYATFYLAIYDEASGLLRYTNAGHLPPILVRDGQASRLNVDGTVVGAFPFARYDESQLQTQSGDLLLCFTDGVSEPENEFGEMFGEERLTDLVVRNAHKSDAEILDTIIGAVEQWTGSPELQDDMTLLLARRA